MHQPAYSGSLNLRQADYGSCIRRVNLSTGFVGTLAGQFSYQDFVDGVGTVARFYGPHGIAMNAAGSVALIVSISMCVYTINKLVPVMASVYVRCVSVPQVAVSPQSFLEANTALIHLTRGFCAPPLHCNRSCLSSLVLSRSKYAG